MNNIKLRSISSILKVVLDDFNVKANKIEFRTTSHLLNKTQVLKILSSVSPVKPSSINSLNVKKYKWHRSFNNFKSDKNKYSTVCNFKRVVVYKKFIITFEHSVHKTKFLNDLGIS